MFKFYILKFFKTDWYKPSFQNLFCMFRSILERNCTVYTRLKLKLYNFRHSLFDPTKYKKVKYVMVVNIYGYKHLCLHSSAEIRRKMPYGGTISNYVTTPRYQYPQVPIPPVPIPPGTNTPRYQYPQVFFL